MVSRPEDFYRDEDGELIPVPRYQTIAFWIFTSIFTVLVTLALVAAAMRLTS